MGRSDTGVRTGWTKKGTVGNSLWRAPLGGNGWKQRLGGRRRKSSGGKEQCGSDDRVDCEKPGGIAWGELRWEGAIRECMTTRWTERKPWERARGIPRELRGKERYGSDRVWAEGKPWEIAWGELRWEKRE